MFYNTITAAEPYSNYILFPVPGYTGYFVTVSGECFSNKSGSMKRISPKRAKNGYLIISVTIDKVRSYPYLHTLMLTTFAGPRPEGHIACHGPDATKHNCAINNLRWDTRKANAADYIQSGGSYGKIGGPKLTPDDVRAIRRDKLEGATNRSLADRHGVGLDTIRHILTRHTWAHVA